MRSASTTKDVATAFGPARVTIAETTRTIRAQLFLGHGAGGGIDAPDLVALALALPAIGIRVCRVEQPYRVAGKRLMSDKRILDGAFVTAVTAVRDVKTPIFVGGRSAGARVAARTARQLGAAGLVALAFPLLPPKGGPSRAPELVAAGVPALVVQGTRDPFGGPLELRKIPLPKSTEIHAVTDGDHAFSTRRASGRAPGDAFAEIAHVVADFVDRAVGTGRRRSR
jgi:predicted alpha/beta-hydrolase family hydrolase